MALLLVAGLGAPAAADTERVAVFDFELWDTSLEGELRGPDPAEEARLAMVDEALRARLESSAEYELVDLAPAAGEVAATGYLRSCEACAVRIAKGLGADLAAVGWVQKVSDLILNINLSIRDVATGERVFAGSVDIRGNTDESWQHGIRYLLERRLFKE